MTLPSLAKPLSSDHLSFLQAFSKSCRYSIIAMLKNSQSGHPGGSLSTIDYLSLLYCFIISQTGEDVVVSHGHISPAVYSTLAELGYINKKDVIAHFRQVGSLFEGHVARHIPGITYGTGPLGVGGSAAAGFALAEKLKKTDKRVFCLMGDGEAQEGQVYEMVHFAAKEKLNNLILFIDANRVQLTGSIKEIMPVNLKAFFQASDWQVIEADGHDYQNLWQALRKASQSKTRPTVILGQTIMGKGVDFMEKEGKKLHSNWHGNAPKPEQADSALKKLALNPAEEKILAAFLPKIKWHPPHPNFIPSLKKLTINPGQPTLYTPDKLTDCRTAYGEALADLAEKNPEILALTADLRGSVMTKFVAEKKPLQHVECGIAEQHMISLAGGLSLKNYVPFASTFGAFISSRAKDQARVNDINRTNVKMVATHCGLSVGEDGPTHQAIDDSGSFLGMFNTMVVEPADPNHTDRIIRYIASHFGNFYVRMGRHKIPVITKENGQIFYDEKYQYEYGKSDLLRTGKDLTILACGSLVSHALLAVDNFRKDAQSGRLNQSIELIAVSSLKSLDQTILNSIKKTKKVLTIEDHNPASGLASQLAKFLLDNQIYPEQFASLSITAYQLSGKSQDLYAKAGLDDKSILQKCLTMLNA